MGDRMGSSPIDRTKYKAGCHRYPALYLVLFVQRDLKGGKNKGNSVALVRPGFLHAELRSGVSEQREQCAKTSPIDRLRALTLARSPPRSDAARSARDVFLIPA